MPGTRGPVGDGCAGPSCPIAMRAQDRLPLPGALPRGCAASTTRLHPWPATWTALVPARIRPCRLSVCRVEPNTSAPPPGRRSSACPIPPCSSDTAIACSKPSTSTRKRNAAFVSLYDDRALADPITDWYDCVEHA